MKDQKDILKSTLSRSNAQLTSNGSLSAPRVPAFQLREDTGQLNAIQLKKAVQLQKEEESLQMKRIMQFQQEEEEPLQMKFVAQFQEEEEDVLQGRFIVQRAVPEEEEPLQMKSVAQFQEEEEDILQGRFIVQRAMPEEEEPLQMKSVAQFQEEEEPLQMKASGKNQTGLPDQLKSGVENLSGYAMDDVKVHYNSDRPAQLNAHAYAQSTDIHVAPGQEKHLPHEAWHVAQQKQGRVQPTMQMKGSVAVNDDPGLENEADVMGAKALQMKAKDQNSNSVSDTIVQRLISMKGEGAARRSKGSDSALEAQVVATIATGSRQGMLDTIDQLEASVAARETDPAGVDSSHQDRIDLENRLITDIRAAYNALPPRARRRRGNVEF